jgi:hypothetical protein
MHKMKTTIFIPALLLLLIPATSLGANSFFPDRAEQIKQETGIDIGTYQEAAREAAQRQEEAESAQKTDFGLAIGKFFLRAEEYAARTTSQIANWFSSLKKRGYVPFTAERKLRKERIRELEKLMEEEKVIPKLVPNPFNFPQLPPGVTTEEFQEAISAPAFLSAPVVPECRDALSRCPTCPAYVRRPEDAISSNIPDVCRQCIAENYQRYQSCLSASKPTELVLPKVIIPPKEELEETGGVIFE